MDISYNKNQKISAILVPMLWKIVFKRRPAEKITNIRNSLEQYKLLLKPVKVQWPGNLLQVWQCDEYVHTLVFHPGSPIQTRLVELM